MPKVVANLSAAPWHRRPRRADLRRDRRRTVRGEAAGEKDVDLHGASAIRQALAAGALDELQVVEAPGATHVKYWVAH